MTDQPQGQVLQLKDSLLNLIQMDRTYSLDVQLNLDDTQAQITGTIAQPGQLKGLDLHLTLQGPDPAGLSPILGITLPSLPAYKIKTHLTREDVAWKFSDFQGTIGDSHLAGAITLQNVDERPLVKADITSRQLNLDDLAGLVAMPEAEPALPGEGPVIPRPLQAVDAEISFQGRRIRASQFTANNISANLELKKGQLTIEPLTLDTGGGKVRASMALDTTIQPVRGHMKIDLDNVDLGQALQPLEVTAVGTLDALLSFFLVGETLILEDSQITYRNPYERTDITALINTELVTEGADSEVNIKGSGKLHGESFYLNLTGGPLFDLLEPDQPFPLTADIKAGDTRAEIEGTLTQPFKPKGMDIDLLLEGPDPARLFPILGLALPSLPPYRVEGRLSWKGYSWKFQDFQGLVGDSDLSGDITVETGGERPLMEAELISDRLDFDDLTGLVGAAPRTGPGETVSQLQKREALAEARDEFVLPDEPLELRRLKTMDARVDFRAKRVHAPALPLDDVVMKVELEDGRLVLKPLNFIIGQGNIRSRIEIDRSTLPVRDSVEAEIQRINLREILKPFDIAEDSVGIIGGRIKLQGTGTSVAKFLGSANGELALIMTDGKLDSLLVELAGLDAGEALITALGDTQSVDIGCALADLQVKDGIATVKALVIDTSDTRFTGRGSINLSQERFDLVLEPHPKDPSLLAAPSPLHVEGRFKEPTAYPDTTELIARSAAAVALGAVATPLAALIPLIDPLGGYLTWHAMKGRVLPEEAVVDIAPPFPPGHYLIAHGGSTPMVNGHLKTLNQAVERFRPWRGQSKALDIFRITPLGFHKNGWQPTDPARYTIFGVPVVAPCRGEVALTVDGLEDMPVPEMDRDHMAGNHVAIDCGDFFVILAHLRRASIAVATGDKVKIGDFLGQVGNSGNSSEPHLHLHAQRGLPEEAPLAGEPVWLTINGRFLVRNDRLHVF